ncbi:MAG: alpha/beta hydrolase [Propionibacteriaceae bacterium]|nr:alpha/beta hydrolase [Propionibacteriaceae bacterium]
MSSDQFTPLCTAGPIKYIDLPGDDLPVMFIHGLSCASTLDYPLVAQHAGLTGHRRLLVDLPGSGASSRPVDYDYSITGHARHLDSFLDGLGLSRVVLFGHSMGGSVVTSLAALNPGRVAGIMLTESNLDPGGGAYSRRVTRHRLAQFVANGYADMLVEARTESPYWARDLALAWPVSLHKEAQSLIDGTVPSWRQMLYELDCPRCYVFGEFNLPDSDADELPRHGVNIMMVPGAGHDMAWQNPDGLGDVIVAFLETIA